MFVTVADPVFTASVPVASGTVGTAYAQQVTIAGGKAPYSAFSATGLPPGLTISSTGTISGTPTTAGSYTATITVTDSSSSAAYTPAFDAPAGFTGTATLALAVSAPGVPTFPSAFLTYGSTVAYNTGSAAATAIDVATLGAVTGGPTAWYLGSTGTGPPASPKTAPPSPSMRRAWSPTCPRRPSSAPTASRSAPTTTAATPSWCR